MNRDNPQTNTYYDIGWIVGIIEGEGWMIFNRQLQPSKSYRYVPVIGMNTTSEEILRKYINILKKWDIGVWVGKRRFLKTNNKDQWMTNVRGFKRCSKLIPILKPYLTAKKKQLDLLEQYILYRKQFNCKQSCGDIEEKMFQQMQSYNRRGKVSTTKH